MVLPDLECCRRGAGVAGRVEDMKGKKQRASAEYIANACRELAELAEYSGYRTGSYLLRMACLEFAEQQESSKETLKA
jgi:hypothetical protein